MRRGRHKIGGMSRRVADCCKRGYHSPKKLSVASKDSIIKSKEVDINYRGGQDGTKVERKRKCADDY